MALQPDRRANALHGGGKGFIESRVVLHIKQLVRQFMKQQARKITFLPACEGAQQRITAQPVQIAQRGIGRHAVDAGLQPLGLHLLGFLLGVGLGKIATVGNAAGDREAPLVHVQTVRWRRHHIPHRIFARQLGVAGVAGIVWQPKLLAGKAPHLLRGLQALAQRG